MSGISGRVEAVRSRCAEIPNPKLQIKTNFKKEKKKRQRRASALRFLLFCLHIVVWNLELGIWDFPVAVMAIG
jgi:hypothetical protein